MSVYAVLEIGGRVVALDDPSGGSFNAAGDFDRLLPVKQEAFPVMARVSLYGKIKIPHPNLASLACEVGVLLDQARQGPERRGLLRLHALALAGQRSQDAELWFVGD